jgi:hypothetical protein
MLFWQVDTAEPPGWFFPVPYLACELSRVIIVESRRQEKSPLPKGGAAARGSLLRLQRLQCRSI